jgi:outer membrane protein assembly factor BamD
MKYISILLAFVVLLTISGCSTKKTEIYNKPAIFWYQGIIKKVRSGDLDSADDYYTSLSSEHVESPLLKTSMLILAQAHSENEEYILANFYLDEYIKRFGDSSSIEYAKFLKIKTNFYAFKYPKRDQVLLNKTTKNAYTYIKTYPDSVYLPLVQTMLTKLSLAQKSMDLEIISLYKRTGKPKAAKIYENKLNSSWYKNVKMIKPNTAWYREIFE